jgi:DNA invertase Pin-like site-specific DNA recombinase
LGRNLQDLIRIVNELDACGLKLKSLKESSDTGGPVGQLVFHMFAAPAEFEHRLVRERAPAGLETAWARGRKAGRPTSSESGLR